MTSTDEVCCAGTCCEETFLCNERCIQECLQISCCDGYARCEGCDGGKCDCCYQCSSTIREYMSDKCCEGIHCLPTCCLWYHWAIPAFVFIVGGFWAIILFVIFFMPPVLFLLLSLPYLHADKLKLFEWISPKMIRADNTGTGHVHDPWRHVKSGWFRCFLISLGLTCLGWFPGVIFDICFIVFYFAQMCREGW